jgi:hypothetical protein
MQLKDVFSKLDNPVSGYSVGLFRIGFGALMFLDVIYYFNVGLIEKGILGPRVLFPYDFLEWVTPIPSAGVLKLFLALMGLGALMMSLGLWSRIGAALFFVFNSYLFTLDKSLYNNHIYFFSLVAFLLIWIDADRTLSLKNKIQGKSPSPEIPSWQLWILQFQLIVVYFYGGIAKINMDWLTRWEPMRAALKSITPRNGLVEFLNEEFMVAFFTYSGLIFDLVIGFLLLYKPTRWIALGSVVFFNITNSWIFDDIGVFPFTMLAATILFFDTRGLFEKTVKKGRKEKVLRQESFNSPSWLKTGLVVYVCFQLLFPFRYWLLPNDVDWTSVGQRFSWRMKIQYRDIKKMEWKVRNGDTGEEFPVDLAVFTHDMQRRYMGDDARYAYRFAQYLVDFSQDNGIANPEVYADIEVSFNGRPVQKFIKPDVDLSKVSYSPFEKIDWIMPLEEQ